MWNNGMYGIEQKKINHGPWIATSAHIYSVNKTQKPEMPIRVFQVFYTFGGTRKGGLAGGKVRKCPVDTSLARGRVPQISDAFRRNVDEI